MMGEGITMLKVPSLIAKVETMNDGGLKVIVHTQELAALDESEVMRLRNKIGWFVFNDKQITEADIPDEPIEFNNQKTASERLRNVLFRLFEKQGGKPEDYEPWRIRQMEVIINRIKAKLDDYEN